MLRIENGELRMENGELRMEGLADDNYKMGAGRARPELSIIHFQFSAFRRDDVGIKGVKIREGLPPLKND